MLTEKTGNMQMNSKLKSNVISNKAEVAVAASAVWVVATGPLQREEVSAVTSTETKVNFPISSNPYSVNAGEAAEEVRLDSKGRTSMPNCIFLYAMPQRPTNKSWKSTVKKIRITVPAGVADGQTIKLNGQGGPGMNGGPTGDLYITFVIGDDPVYKREGDNLYMNVPIDLYTAVLGGEQIIETLNGKVKMKIKPETQNGTKVRLRGKGFPVYKQDGQFGDLFVTYEVKIPTHLTEKQKELFRELQNS